MGACTSINPEENPNFKPGDKPSDGRNSPVLPRDCGTLGTGLADNYNNNESGTMSASSNPEENPNFKPGDKPWDGRNSTVLPSECGTFGTILADNCNNNESGTGSLKPLHREKPKFRSGHCLPLYDDGYVSGSSYTPLRTDERNYEDKNKKEEKLKTVSVAYCKFENRYEHHTDEYELAKLIIRRGQTFKLIVKFEGSFNESTDSIVLQFTTGKKPIQSKGTLVRVKETGNLTPSEWGFKISKQEDTSVTLEVMPACDAVVGKYELFVITSRKNEAGEIQKFRFKHEDEMYILYNAWCPEDTVYLSTEDEREEYVMNETGRVYVGSSGEKVYGRPWNFGQFEKVCFEAGLYILDISSLNTAAFGNPIQVTRTISAMANSSDNDSGILTGNWSGDFKGGTPPTAWCDSVAILEEYMKYKKDVKYGQCWVFSALIVTLCRTLGIPTRSITNFQSAHDSDFSMTIDFHIDLDGRPLKHLNESVWNFHVWNESWLKRPDLPEGCDGWQAFDATPQEASEGIMRCGPAPVTAIKEGKVFLGYDTKFIFAEVNGDKITWYVDEEGDAVPADVRTESVGKKISTKSVGSDQREDVTDHYKHREGSEEERMACQRVCNWSTKRDKLKHIYEIIFDQDVKMSFFGNPGEGGDVTFEAKLQNTSKEIRNVAVKMYATAKYYTGIIGEEIGEHIENVELQPDESKSVTWYLSAEFYLNKLDEDAELSVWMLARVKETKQVYSNNETFNIDKPDLEITVDKNKVQVGEEIEATIVIFNPLNIALSSGALFVTGPGIPKNKKIPIKEKLQPGQRIEEKIKFTPKLKCKREVIACFNSKQLSGLTGSASIQVTQPSTE